MSCRVIRHIRFNCNVGGSFDDNAAVVTIADRVSRDGGSRNIARVQELECESILSSLLTHVGELDTLNSLSNAWCVEYLEVSTLESSAAGFAFDLDIP